jgi:TetR/AcrR family transcriptional repressor of nem operon
VLDLYFSLVTGKIVKTLRNDALPPLKRLRSWFDVQIEFLKQSEFRSGCLIGNFTMESSGQSEAICDRLGGIIKEIEGSVACCLKEAVKAGELPKSTNAGELASFVYASWQGAILQAKIEHSPEPLQRFKSVLFGHVLLGKIGCDRAGK